MNIIGRHYVLRGSRIVFSLAFRLFVAQRNKHVNPGTNSNLHANNKPMQCSHDYKGYVGAERTRSHVTMINIL